MNIISFILVIVAVVLFVGAGRGLKWGSIGLGLACISIAWALQILWTADHISAIS